MPSAVFDAPLGLRPRVASKTTLGIYPVPPQKPDVNLYIRGQVYNVGAANNNPLYMYKDTLSYI